MGLSALMEDASGRRHLVTGEAAAGSVPAVVPREVVVVQRPRSARALQTEFWRAYIHVGVASYLLGGVVAVTYLVATPHGPHRSELVALDGSSLAATVGLFWWVGIRLVPTRWRTPFFAVWTISTLGFIGAGAILDGGATSPLVFFLIHPLIFAGLAYPPRTASTLTGVAVVDAVIVGSLSRHPSVWQVVLLGGAMLIGGLLTTAVARNRDRMTAAVVEAANHDGLTGCLTRRALYERLQHEVARARRYGTGFAIVLADLDRLKALNDEGGHEHGDEALQRLAAVLMSSARSSDLVGRLGGDEFALLLPQAGAEEAEAVARRLVEAVRGAGRPPITASMGVAVWAGPSDGLEELLRRADRAMYEAKRTGRDQFRVS
jgi:diguanylate cyclase (GGDEF)-like protein